MTHESTLHVPTRPRVLFVGRETGSPQVAANLLRHATADQVTAETVSTQLGEPGRRCDEMLVAMGLNPADQQPLSTRALYTADRVIVLDPDLDVARLPGPRYEEWDLEDDDLVTRVDALSDNLTAAVVPTPSPLVLDRLRALLGAIGRVIGRRRQA